MLEEVLIPPRARPPKRPLVALLKQARAYGVGCVLATRNPRLGALVKKLAPRWFVVRSAKNATLTLLHPRWAMSYLRGPMTQSEIRRARVPRA